VRLISFTRREQLSSSRRACHRARKVSLNFILPQVPSWPALNQSFALGPHREKKRDHRSYNDVTLARTPKSRFRRAADAIPFNMEVTDNHRTFHNLAFCNNVKILEACSFHEVQNFQWPYFPRPPLVVEE
jgi:hypothetical protein